MAYNGKYNTPMGVIESSFRDAGLNSIDFEAAIEWTAELILLLGIPYVLVDKVTNGLDGMPSALNIVDYRTKLPDDLESLTAVRKVYLDDENNITGYDEMIESSDVFHFTDVPNSSSSSVSNPVVNLDEFDPSDENFIHSRSQYEVKSSEEGTGSTFQYKIDSGYIYTNFKEGFVQVAYKGFPIDNYGFPMIPDDEKFRQALKYHIISKIDWKNWRINPSPQSKAIYNDSNQKRDFYVASARSKAHTPSIDKMEALKNQWLRSISRINGHSQGFRTINLGERRYNQYLRRRRR